MLPVYHSDDGRVSNLEQKAGVGRCGLTLHQQLRIDEYMFLFLKVSKNRTEYTGLDYSRKPRRFARKQTGPSQFPILDVTLNLYFSDPVSVAAPDV